MSRGIEIEQDLPMQRRQWRIERIALAVMSLVAVAAVLGLLGNGPLSDAVARAGDERLAVGYDRFVRYGAPVELGLQLTDVSGKVELSIDASYLEGFDIDNITPQPDGQTVRAGSLRLTFEDFAAPGSVSLSLTPREIGVQRARIALSSSEPVSFSQLVYP